MEAKTDKRGTWAKRQSNGEAEKESETGREENTGLKK